RSFPVPPRNQCLRQFCYAIGHAFHGPRDCGNRQEQKEQRGNCPPAPVHYGAFKSPAHVVGSFLKIHVHGSPYMTAPWIGYPTIANAASSARKPFTSHLPAAGWRGRLLGPCDTACRSAVPKADCRTCRD